MGHHSSSIIHRPSSIVHHQSSGVQRCLSRVPKSVSVGILWHPAAYRRLPKPHSLGHRLQNWLARDMSASSARLCTCNTCNICEPLLLLTILSASASCFNGHRRAIWCSLAQRIATRQAIPTTSLVLPAPPTKPTNNIPLVHSSTVACSAAHREAASNRRHLRERIVASCERAGGQSISRIVTCLVGNVNSYAGVLCVIPRESDISSAADACGDDTLGPWRLRAGTVTTSLLLFPPLDPFLFRMPSFLLNSALLQT